MSTVHDTTVSSEPAHIVRPGGGRRYQAPSPEIPLPGVDILLDGRRGAPFSVMTYDVPAGFAPPPVLHRHTREFAAVYVLDGELTYWLADGSANPAPAGSLVVVATDWFRWANQTDRPARILCIFSPAGFEEFFVGIHESMAQVGHDMAKFGEVILRLRTEFGDEAHPG